MCDSAAIRAHQQAAGTQKEHGPQALGHSRGGFGTKIHSIIDALGHAIGFTLTGSEQAGIGQATKLLEKALGAEAVIGDRGYGSDKFVQHIEAQGA